VHTVFWVAAKSRSVGRNGKPYLVLSLGDRTGEIDARIFDGVEQAESLFAINDYVLLEGRVISFHGKLQILIDKVERLAPEPIDAREFILPKDPQRSDRTGGVVGQIRQAVDQISDSHIKAVLAAFLDDREIAQALLVASMSREAYSHRGGLAEHLLSTMRLAHRIADHYPKVDRDLLVAGALLHDIGRVREVSPETSEMTDEGQLVGRVVMTAQDIRQKASQIAGFPPLLEQHLTHLVLAAFWPT
jgi:3'-5' exoribonuclease